MEPATTKPLICSSVSLSTKTFLIFGENSFDSLWGGMAVAHPPETSSMIVSVMQVGQGSALSPIPGIKRKNDAMKYFNVLCRAELSYF